MLALIVGLSSMPRMHVPGSDNHTHTESHTNTHKALLHTCHTHIHTHMHKNTHTPIQQQKAGSMCVPVCSCMSTEPRLPESSSKKGNEVWLVGSMKKCSQM